ncbi:unnamed protein product [Lactuca virosa]|uniref:Secreted protein n=1 Tax=Lactuca virosa TaxID=75947 RepID=A0AAU9LQU3_9ASTR|nr:unnamed protein product [Lactuca virosa]
MHASPTYFWWLSTKIAASLWLSTKLRLHLWHEEDEQGTRSCLSTCKILNETRYFKPLPNSWIGLVDRSDVIRMSMV